MWLYIFVCFLINTNFSNSFEIADKISDIAETDRTFLTITKGETKPDISRFESAQQLQQILKCVEIIVIHDAGSTNDNLDSFEASANELEKLTNSDVLHFCVRALRDKMPDDLKKPFKWIRLAKILEKRVLNESKVKYSTKNFVQFTADELKDSISVFTLEALNASVRSEGFEKNSEMDNLTTAIYLFDPLQWEYIMEEFVNTNYAQVSFGNILKIITSHRFIQQKAKGLCKLFGKIESAGKLNSNDNDTIKIASALHDLRSENEFQTLNKTQLDEVNETIDKIPTCTKDLLFLPSVSCWKKGKEKYVAAELSRSTLGNIRSLAFSADSSQESHKNAILAIIGILETRVLKEPNVVYLTNQYKKFTTDELKYSISVFTLEALNAAVKNAGFEKNGEMDNLTTAIYLYDPLQWECIIEEFINANYDKVSFSNILKTITSHTLVQQRAKGLCELFEKIENTGNLNSKDTIKIALAFQKLLARNEFKTLCKTQLDEVNKTIDKLPTCARNLVSVPSICLWNKGNEKYITAGTSEYGISKRYVYTADISRRSIWNFNVIGDEDTFLFSSQFYPNEPLYVSPNYKHDETNLRHVFDWTSEPHDVDNEREWSVVLNGDYCYIKNVHFNEYMFSSEYKGVGEEGSLVLIREAEDFDLVNNSTLQWEIRKCEYLF